MQTIQTATGPVEFVDQGSGPAILYFHGTLSGALLAVGLERRLIDAGYRLIVPHRPGFFGTPLDGRTTSSDCADLAAELLDHLGITRAAVIGTSAGGPPAIRFAARHRARTAALVLQCAQVHRWDAPEWAPPAHRWIYLGSRQNWSRWLCCRAIGLLIRARLRSKQRYLRDLTGARYQELSAADRTGRLLNEAFQTRQQFRQHGAGFANDMAMWAREDVLAETPVDCPTLILHDRQDPHASVRHAEFAAATIPNSRLITLRLGGHVIWIGPEVDEMHAARLEFLQQHLPTME